MAFPGSGSNAWIQLNSLGWDGSYLTKEGVTAMVEALSKSIPVYFNQPHLAFEQLFYHFHNVAIAFYTSDRDLAYNAHIAGWVCNNCRASLVKPTPHPARQINEKEEYLKFFPDRQYLPRHLLADRLKRAESYIKNLPHGLHTTEWHPICDIETFYSNIEDDYPNDTLPIELALPIATLKQAVAVHKSGVINVVCARIVQETIPNTYTKDLTADLAEARRIYNAGAVEPVVHQPRGDERGAEHEGARGQDQPL